jgi:c-di-AMP phosphodiesterase-like protein
MPLELELAVDPPPDDVVVAAAPPEELDDCVEAGAADELVELEELEPQAATAMATKTSSSGASRRIERCRFEVMNAPSARLGKAQLIP